MTHARCALRPFLMSLPLVLILLASPVAAQTATLQEAWQLMQARHYEEAVSALTAFTTANPENPQAWLLLGQASQSAGDLDGALEAFDRAAAFESSAPQALYNAGLVYAQRGDRDEAFARLFLAQETRRIDVTQIGISPVADTLRSDPRYARLFPTPEAYADPFVEPVEILHEWVGEAEGDQFGWIARNVGDVDGDGVNDVTTSAPSFGADGSNAGKVYVYSGRTGALVWTAEGTAGDQLGLGIEAAGDVNADGVPDVVAGAPGGGKTYVYSGRDGTVLLMLTAEDPADGFGRKVADVGDVNADGHDDVLVGAPNNDAGGQDAGRAYVYSGRDGTALLTLTGEEGGDNFGSSGAGYSDGRRTFLVVGAPGAGPQHVGRVYVYSGLTDEPSFVIEADETGAWLGGMFVSVVGDVNADGVPDVYASDWANRAKGRSTGRIYVHSGADGERLLTLTGEAAGDGFGIGPADAGDVNGDGHDDLIVGAWQHAGAAPSGGKCYLYSGKDGTLLAAYTGKVPGETFGFDATGMGDVNGDGVTDLLLTSAWSAIHGTRSGRMYIISSGVR